MKETLIVVLILSLFLGCKEPSAYVIENVQIVDLKSGETNSYNLLIRDDKIERLSNEKIKGFRKIDLKGKYLMPSLWDMHVHLHADRSKLTNYFRNGVLGLRDMGAFTTPEVDSLVKWNTELRKDPSLRQSHIAYAGLINNDTTCYHGHRNIGDYQDLIDSYRYLDEIGSSFYKIHNCFPYELLPQLDSIAEVQNFAFGGHIPEGMDPLEYVKEFDNINSIEHVSVLLRALNNRKEMPLTLMEAVTLLDGGYLDTLAVAMKEKNIAFTPNLLSEVEFIDSYPEEQKHLGEAFLARLNNYVKRIAEHGVLILAGTDSGLDSDPDVTLYKELELLSAAGLSNLQVLQTATINADMALGQAVNLITERSEASFVILDHNPLEDLSTLKHVFGIVHNGDYVELAEN